MPDGPPFLSGDKSSFVLPLENAIGSPSAIAFWRHFGCMLFHHLTHSSANTCTSGIFGMLLYLRVPIHFVNRTGRSLAGIRYFDKVSDFKLMCYKDK
jgi:hypothetical protein